MVQLSDLQFPPPRAVLTATALFTAGFLTHSLLTTPYQTGSTPSPRTTLLPTLSKPQQSALPYPPDALPGARDIPTPYGTFRAYEWGPKTGKKVLFVHGITTPCVALAAVAHGLVDHGCRVCLFDLPGRGYSDNPVGVEHDVRLFTAQILLVLASSELSWTTEAGGFVLVGYSLGGGIAASFASYMPALVDDLVLLAPAGLLRDHQISISSRVIYSRGLFPEGLLRSVVKGRLRTPLVNVEAGRPAEDGRVADTDAVQAEVDTEGKPQDVLSKTYPRITPAKVVNHQVDNHHGFVGAFMSSIRYGPIRDEHARWREIARRVAEGPASRQKKVLVVLGKRDPVIVLDEVMEDAAGVLGEHVRFEVLDAAHDVPITMAGEIAGLIWEHCQ